MLVNKNQKLAITGLLLAIGIILPFATAHGIGIPGTVLLPMHIPVLLCGLLCGPAYGFGLGLVLPILNSLLTGMPVLYPMAPIMTAELCVYGLVSGLAYHKAGLKKYRVGVYPALLVAMVCGRVAYGLTFQALLLLSGKLKAATVWTAVMVGVPGIVVQMFLIPPIVAAVTYGTGVKRKRAVESAINLIREERAVCIVIKNGVIVKTETGRGVQPIIGMYESGILKDAYVVDKVVGKAAAMVMTKGGIKGCHAVTVSRGALEWFQRNRIEVEYDTCAEYIINRKGDGMCPMEQTVKELFDDTEVIDLLKKRLAEMQKGGTT